MSAGFFQLENIVVEGYRDDANDPIKKEVFSNIYEKMIYIVLSRHANNNNGVAYPSVATIAKEALCSITTVKKCIKTLENKGLISKTLRPKSNKDNNTNLYIIKKLSEVFKDIFLPQSQGDVAQSQDDYKEELHKNNYIEDHDNNNSHAKTKFSKKVNPDLDTFEDLFKKIGISFTTKNQLSVKALLKKMSVKQVTNYLIETYENIKNSPGVINIAGLFSMKIAKQERQMTKTVRQNIAAKEKEIEATKQFEKRIHLNDPITVFNSLSPSERLKVEKKALSMFIAQSSADEKIMLTMREKNNLMYLNTIKLQLEKALKVEER